MTVIDVANYRELGQAAGLGDILPLYFERVEGVAGGWRCKHCQVVFPDRIAYGPPPAHECPKMLCANCDQEAGIRQLGSHGICPRHLVTESLATTTATHCFACNTPLGTRKVVYAFGNVTVCHTCRCTGGSEYQPRVTA